MTKKILTQTLAQEIQRLYELQNSGRKIYSQLQIANILGVSETTVFRAIHKRAAGKEPPDDIRAQESLAKFQQTLECKALEKMQKAIADVRAAPDKTAALLEELTKKE